MLDENNLFQQAAVASSAYASMAAFTAAANMYSSFYPTTANPDPNNYLGCNEMQRERLDPKVRVKLEGLDLWKQFHSLGTEMIITKNGRRLFPTFRVSVSELDPNMKYMFLLDIVPVDDNRYKYQESAWVISGKAEPHAYGRYFIHPDSPQTGEQWMKQSILFNKAKITNNPMQNPDQILLNSMHRYVIRLHIVQASDEYSIRTGPLSTYTFNETVFIAVTAYQNDEIKNLKIDNNPFAKGFREPTHGKKNSSKALKRLQSSLPLDKSTKYDDTHHRLCKSDTSLLSSNSISPPVHQPIVDSTYGHPEPEADPTNFNFSSAYQQPLAYNTYPNDSSLLYNPYIGSTMSFSPYGYYSSNNFSAPFF
ncbi:unnamed protein product [Adineta ricciae]|uniref:T-box domain-containing protein n=1 Tax=Adineta ricciae TaxID=249248 RepID=A0A813XYA3_ADIRI|nr:unnamed protein product [Adineta ricciae]CAF0946988.1 unnamed protein product [Adineta ricciae]